MQMKNQLIQPVYRYLIYIFLFSLNYTVQTSFSINGNTVKKNSHAAYLKSQLSQSFGNENRFPRCITQNQREDTQYDNQMRQCVTKQLLSRHGQCRKPFKDPKMNFPVGKSVLGPDVFYQIYFELLWAF